MTIKVCPTTSTHIQRIINLLHRKSGIFTWQLDQYVASLYFFFFVKASLYIDASCQGSAACGHY